MFGVIVGPRIMFGCTYDPCALLGRVPAMKYLVLVTPVVYVSEGMRAAVTPSMPHTNALVVVAVLLAITVLFMVVGLRSFLKRALT